MKSNWRRVVPQWARPRFLRRIILKVGVFFGLTPIPFRVSYNLIERPHYAYGIYQAAMQAKALGLPAISVIEFGVAGGSGLVAMERLSKEVSIETGVRVQVYGFDSGGGLPPPKDYRDLPYVWQSGDYVMDEQKLRAVLTDAELVLGDVSDTVREFVQRKDLAPIGFIAFDLDYYSSTKQAFDLLLHNYNLYLPRLWMYFDDIISDDTDMYYCEDVGELLAIKEFNEENEVRKIRIHNGLRDFAYPPFWREQIFIGHFFQHPLYGKFINPKKDHLPLV